MRLNFHAVSLCAALIGALALAMSPADAAQKKKKHVAAKHTTTVVTGRARSRIVVRPRSFLDGGTEVLPGERKFTDYALPPGYSPTSTIDNTAFSHRSPLPGPFDLPSRNNPYPWNWCVGC
jgi:hypothetical protein